MSHRWLPTFSGRWNFRVAVTRPSLQSYCLEWNALDQRGRRNGLERLVHAFSNQIGDFTATCESLIQRAEARSYLFARLRIPCRLVPLAAVSLVVFLFDE